mmetsp:Transcript_31933/g.83685  ORF Transcript_31933/g.83685 Transcript_31933/m.83685 type:complete len:480 (-) Transcript_31933:64-1503(-)
MDQRSRFSREGSGLLSESLGRRAPLSPISRVPWAADDEETTDDDESSVLLGSAINGSAGYIDTALSTPTGTTGRGAAHTPRARQAVRQTFAQGHTTPAAHQTCHACNGKGVVQTHKTSTPRRGSFVEYSSKSVDTNGQLVTLVSASDHRLKPRRTKLIVSIWVGLTLAVAAIVAFVLWPRDVDVSAPIEFSFSDFTGLVNCPPLPTNRACVDQSCAQSRWPDLPYCDTSNQSTFNATICSSIKGCTYQGKNGRANATYADCWTCNDPKMQTQDACETAQSDDVQKNCVWRDDSCDSSQIGPIGFVFNYTLTVSNENYLAVTLVGGHATVAFTDITDSGEEQNILVFDGAFGSSQIPARSTSTVIVPVNVTIGAVNFSNTAMHAKTVLKPIESLKRIILHDVCVKTAGKCGKDAGGGDLPERNQFFVTFKMNLTASTGPARFPLDQDRVIALRRHCPIQNGTASTTTTTTTTTTLPSFAK